MQFSVAVLLVAVVAASAPIGIDIGSSTSVVAAPRRGGIDILVNEASQRQTPSIVSFDADHRLIGESAHSRLVSHPQSCVTHVKTMLAARESDIQRLQSSVDALLDTTDHGDVQVKLYIRDEEHSFSAIALFAMLVQECQTLAERELGGVPSECVIAVPLHFDAVCRQAVLDAAQIAGLRKTHLISDVCLRALASGDVRW